MSFVLSVLESVCSCGKHHLNYMSLGTFKTRSAAQNAKRKFAFHRSGVLLRSKDLAETMGLRSPWKIEEI
jgi:hypothetical protein